MSLRVADTYITVAIADLSKIDFTQVGETDENTIRKSINDDEFVLKYNAEPSFISDGTVTPLQTMTHEQCLTLMATPEWTEPMPIEE
tara:strand:+ start:720 stop:980 length:261 start_codon:yes stop_codon:yes gene_type:complete